MRILFTSLTIILSSKSMILLYYIFYFLFIFVQMLVCFTDILNVVVGMDLICFYERHAILIFSIIALLKYDDYIDINLEFCLYYNLGIYVFVIRNVLKQQLDTNDEILHCKKVIQLWKLIYFILSNLCRYVI